MSLETKTLTIRVPIGLRKSLKIRAIQNSRSLAEEVLDLIHAGLIAKEKTADEHQLVDR